MNRDSFRAVVFSENIIPRLKLHFREITCFFAWKNITLVIIAERLSKQNEEDELHV